MGHDQISQTIYLPEAVAGGSWDEGETHMFGTDGHGSVRVLYDLAGVIARDDQQRMQVYFYDAYGNLLSLGSSSLTSNTLPLTTYLYSGEAFDFRIGQQYLRARWYDARTGRFDRLDPFAGNSQDPQSFHKYGYVHGDPIQGIDPTGQFLGLVIGIGVQFLLPGPGDFIQGGLEALVKAYVVNLSWDVEWALDMSLPDDWGSRLDDSWVYAALGAGLHDAFNIGTPFGTFNPLDAFGGRDFDFAFGASGSARAPAKVRFAGSHKAAHSITREMPYTKRGKTLWSQVSLYEHPKLGRKIALFDDAISPIGTVKINYAKVPGGRNWKNRTPGDETSMRQSDIDESFRKLDKLGVQYQRSGANSRGDIAIIDGVQYTWHHHHKKGHMQLIPKDIHEKIGHIGMAIWHMF